MLPAYETETQKPSVLEVGAGCGLLGLVLAHAGCRVVLTEQSSTLPNLRRNTTRNSAALDPGPVVAQLQWGEVGDVAAVADHGPFDIIVGTDVWFALDLVEPLLRTMHALSHERTIIYLCMQVSLPCLGLPCVHAPAFWPSACGPHDLSSLCTALLDEGT